MPSVNSQPRRTRALYWVGLSAGIAALVAGCAHAPAPPQARMPTPSPAPAPAPIPPTATLPAPSFTSGATDPKSYRKDAASHLYSQNGKRVYAGKMPPLLYAVGVLQVEIDGRGNVIGTSWMRRPSHAPEVVAEIENAVRRASPFPAPVKMGRVTYTDTWLWDKSGRFQLDTLTEGQI